MYNFADSGKKLGCGIRGFVQNKFFSALKNVACVKGFIRTIKRPAALTALHLFFVVVYGLYLYRVRFVFGRSIRAIIVAKIQIREPAVKLCCCKSCFCLIILRPVQGPVTCHFVYPPANIYKSQDKEGHIGMRQVTKRIKAPILTVGSEPWNQRSEHTLSQTSFPKLDTKQLYGTTSIFIILTHVARC